MTVYYVDGAVGSDLNDGLAEGAGNAWATIQKAADVATNGGDIVYIKNSVTYLEQVNQSILPTAVSSVNPILWIGYNTVPGDFGRVVIDGENSRASAWYVQYQAVYGVWMNITFTRATSYGFNALTFNSDSLTFYNCKFTNNGSYGVACDNVGAFYFCESSNNFLDGIRSDNSTTLVGCELFGNGVRGVYNVGTIETAYKNLIYDNGTDGVYASSGINTGIGNTIVNNPGNGFATAFGGNGRVVTDNVITGSTNGIAQISGSSTAAISEFYDHNCLYNNTTNNSGNIIPELHSVNDVLADPLHIDVPGDDYRVRQNSPLVGAGVRPGVFT